MTTELYKIVDDDTFIENVSEVQFNKDLDLEEFEKKIEQMVQYDTDSDCPGTVQDMVSIVEMIYKDLKWDALVIELFKIKYYKEFKK